MSLILRNKYIFSIDLQFVYISTNPYLFFNSQDIGDLEKTFWSLKGLAKSGQLDLESLAPLISPPVPLSALNGVFSAFDENCDGHIDFKELCCGVSAACRGPNVERSKCMYSIDAPRIAQYVPTTKFVFFLIQFASKYSTSIVIVC